jgi:hypothetical protein
LNYAFSALTTLNTRRAARMPMKPPCSFLIRLIAYASIYCTLLQLQVENDLRPQAREIPSYLNASNGTTSSSSGSSSSSSMRGEYREPLLNANPELRVRSRVDASFRALQNVVTDMNPGFEQPDFPRLLQVRKSVTLTTVIKTVYKPF